MAEDSSLPRLHVFYSCSSESQCANAMRGKRRTLSSDTGTPSSFAGDGGGVATCRHDTDGLIRRVS